MNLKFDRSLKFVENKPKIFENFDLFYYIQVVLKFLKVKYEEKHEKIMDKILDNGGEINYLSGDKENAIFKVF